MNISKEVEDKINIAFVVGIVVFIVILWFLIIPGA